MKILILTWLATLNVWAHNNVSCWENDCLQKGWSKTDFTTGTTADFMCYGSGCEVSGLIVSGNQNTSYYTQCKTKGCYVEGWYEVNRKSHALMAEVECHNSDCLTQGWVTYTKSGPLETVCMKNNCREEGWSSKNTNGSYINAYCKNKSCFTQGWIESK